MMVGLRVGNVKFKNDDDEVVDSFAVDANPDPDKAGNVNPDDDGGEANLNECN